MRAGDATSTGPTNFNVMNSSDFTSLKATFGKSYGQPGYDARADFDNNDAVNSTDFTPLKGNFGQAGCGPGVGPQRTAWTVAKRQCGVVVYYVAVRCAAI